GAGLRADAGVGAAALPAQERDDPARGGLAAEPGVHRVHVPGPAADRLGLRLCRGPAAAEPLAVPLDRLGLAAAGRGVLRLRRVPVAVHVLERRLEPVRTARLPGAGALPG